MTTEPLVLVVDDDEEIRKALERALRLEGFAVRVAEGGQAALELVEQERPGVMVLDVVMPDLSGISVVSRLRARGNDIPICILSARDEVEDRVAGLEAGADDYVVKPFDIGELAARLRALLRRTPAGDGAPIRVGDLVVDPARRSVHRAGRRGRAHAAGVRAARGAGPAPQRRAEPGAAARTGVGIRLRGRRQRRGRLRRLPAPQARKLTASRG